MILFSGEHTFGPFLDYISHHHPSEIPVYFAHLPDFKSFSMKNEEGREVDVYWAGYEARLRTIWVVGVPPGKPEWNDIQTHNFQLVKIAEAYAEHLATQDPTLRTKTGRKKFVLAATKGYLKSTANSTAGD